MGGEALSEMVIFHKPKKEIAYLRKANKRHTCKECGSLIPKGDYYVDDHVNTVKRNRVGEGYLVWYRNKICQDCWKAPLC